MSRINAAETAALARALAQSTRETARPLNISGIIRGASVETAQPAAVDPADLDPRRASRLGPDPNAALKGISDAIRKIEALVNERLSAPNPPADALAAAQSQIDALLDGVSAIADDFDFENLDFFAEGRAWRLREPVANVRDIALFDGAPAPGDTLDVNVTVVQSAQPAGLFLHLGAGSLDLDGPDGQFTIEIAGADGVRVFSFASGTSNSSIADAINAFAGVTGVQADVLPVNSANGVGVRFLSAGIGSDEFVSVRILDDAGLEGPSSTLGVWSLADGDFNRLGSLEQPISEAGPPTTDLGRDVRALINNQRAIVDGDTIRIDTPELAVRLTLNRNQFSEGPGLFRPGLIRLAVVGLDPAQAPPLDPDFALERLGRQFNPHGERFALDDLRSGASLNLIDGDLTRILDVIDAARRDLALVEQSGFDNLTRSAATRLSPEEAIAAAQSTRQTLLQSFTRAADIPRNDPALALQLLTPNRPKS